MNPFNDFPELISPFLKNKLQELENEFGTDHWRYQSIARQFQRHGAEKSQESQGQERHYHADITPDTDVCIEGMERLYRRSVVMELTTSCFAHCRWCLRSHYHRFKLSKERISSNLEILAGKAGESVREILLTGGDPMIGLQMLDYTLGEIASKLPQIEIVRIGTRIFTHNPHHIDDDALLILKKHKQNFRIEIGTQINSPIEFFPESVDAMMRMQDFGIVIYNQHPLLKGVNDSVSVLAELYDRMRYLGIESHYLFHCVPMIGMQHHRTTISRGLDLMKSLSSGGYFSGRAKPHYTAMTAVGKITLYHGSFLRKDEEKNQVLLKSGYLLKDRLKYNPSFEMPSSASVDDEGFLNIWYQDGCDDNPWNDSVNAI